MPLGGETPRYLFSVTHRWCHIMVFLQFNLCLEDLVPVAVGRYVKALISSMHPTDASHGAVSSSVEHLLEKMFSLFLEQVNLWSDLCSLPEIKSPGLTESSLYGYLYQYIQLLERTVKLDTLEGINEKLRKRLKNPKLSNSNCGNVYRHVSFAWCRTLISSMALITPLHTRISNEIQIPNLSASGHDHAQLLCVDLQTEELWNSSFEDPNHLKNLEAKWNPVLSNIKNVIIKKASEEDLETASVLLRSSYNFYRDTSCTMLPSGINLYLVPSQLAAETYIQPGIDGVDILDMSTPRKLLLWAYTLLHGHCTSISVVVKYCEENMKSKMRKGTGSSTTPPTAVTSNTGDGKDGMGKCTEPEASHIMTAVTSLSDSENAHNVISTPMPRTEGLCNVTSSSLPETSSLCNVPSAGLSETGSAFNMSAASSLDSGSVHRSNITMPNEGQKISSTTQGVLHCNDNANTRIVEDV